MSASLQFDPAKLVPLEKLVRRGRELREHGIPYVVDGIIPEYGGVGFYVAQSKVGKTTLGLQLVRCVSKGTPFLGRHVKQRRTLMLALEDHPDYLAWLMVGAGFDNSEDARFYPTSLVLSAPTLERLAAFIREESIGFVYVATFMHGVRGLVDDENDNAAMVKVVAGIKAFAREVGIPVLIEAHAGKGEDQSKDADPAKALRGATGAAGEADYLLSLKRESGFSTQRTLSGIGRFVNLPPLTFSLDPATGELSLCGDTADDDYRKLLAVEGGLSATPRSAAELAEAAGWVGKGGRPQKSDRARVHRAVEGRPEVDHVHSGGSGRGKRVSYRLRVGEGVTTPSDARGKRGEAKWPDGKVMSGPVESGHSHLDHSAHSDHSPRQGVGVTQPKASLRSRSTPTTEERVGVVDHFSYSHSDHSPTPIESVTYRPENQTPAPTRPLSDGGPFDEANFVGGEGAHA